VEGCYNKIIAEGKVFVAVVAAGKELTAIPTNAGCLSVALSGADIYSLQLTAYSL